jgi:hypothetical protein
MNKEKKPTNEKESTIQPLTRNNITTLLVIIVIGFAFITGTLWQKVKTLESKNTSKTTTGTNPENNAPEIVSDRDLSLSSNRTAVNQRKRRRNNVGL